MISTTNFFTTTTMTGLELFIVIGGCYALYTVGMAIATEIDYRRTVDKLQKENDTLLSGIE